MTCCRSVLRWNWISHRAVSCRLASATASSVDIAKSGGKRGEKNSSYLVGRDRGKQQEEGRSPRKGGKQKIIPEWKEELAESYSEKKSMRALMEEQKDDGHGQETYSNYGGKKGSRREEDLEREDMYAEEEYARSKKGRRYGDTRNRGKFKASKDERTTTKKPLQKTDASVASPKVKKVFNIHGMDAEKMVLYKDDDIIALNKPAGLAVHSGPKLGRSLSDFLHYWKYEEKDLPHLAHRLDKDTSGVILLTRHKEAARWLADMFCQRKILKQYWAITIGVPDKVKGSLKGYISLRNVATVGGRHSMNRMVLVDRGSESEKAWTKYDVLAVPDHAPHKCALIQLHPITGLKHQLRVHLAEGLQCPVVGDYKFGGRLLRLDTALTGKLKSMSLERGYLYLHAKEIVLPGYHGDNKPPLILQAPLPNYFENATERLRLRTP